MGEESRRQRKISSLLQEALSAILQEELRPESGLLISVTRVDVLSDLRSARVYLSVFGAGDPAAVLARLEERAGAVRRRLASTVELKYNPQLFFTIDPSAAEVERIDRILDESQRDDGHAD
jgi:ribosome-binding factor A